MQTAIIIGAGPAGLTAAYELLTRSREYRVVVLEESGTVGGISRTVEYRGNRMDMGGHRLFSRVPEVNAWWERMLPAQGAPAKDDLALGRPCELKEGGPDPEKTDRVMLRRRRLSRICFNGRFFDYPVRLSAETILGLGARTTLEVGFSYLASLLHRRPERSLEDFYVNRFGKKLYGMFFERYTENLWGRHPSAISAEWGAQRVKGLSVGAVLKDVAGKALRRKNRKVETSLIEAFSYPKLGPGQLWEIAAGEIRARGGEIRTGAKAVGFLRGEDGRIARVVCETEKGRQELPADVVISSMPLRDLVAGMPDVAPEIAEIASGLPYRDYMTLGVLVRKMALKNETKIPTLGGVIPDNWVYVQDRSVRMGRFQVYNNWSPYLAADPEHTVWLGLEYFCDEGDDLWSMDEECFAALCVEEMRKIGLVESPEDVLDWHLERVKKAYPAYFDTYARIGELRAWLDGIGNLYCVGRNGQHRYNNLDHSMCTSFEAVKSILSGTGRKDSVWSVNTEREYHEERGKK